MPLTTAEEIELIQLLEAEKRDNARKNHLSFMKYCWMKNNKDPFIVGFHTKKICASIDEAFKKLKEGVSSYLLISVHHRSGKSDIVSRYLGSHFLGEFPDKEVMQVTYKAEFAASFSGYGRNVLRSDNYNQLYPNTKLSKEVNKKNEWLIVDGQGANTGGKLYASGLHSGLTGNGFTLGILDDFCSGRAEAESLVQRDNAWEAFTNDFMTRISPVGIVIILATQWHWDDIIGRVKASMKENSDFPKFQLLTFPAKKENYRGVGEYKNRYLFLERFPERWYLEQYATLGKYGSAALLDCNPTMRVGGQLSTDGIIYHDVSDAPDFLQVRWARVWDLAHTQKQREKDDPDFTSGTLLAFDRRPDDPIPHLWVRHVFRIRENAVKRDREIKKTAAMDGVFIKQAIENSIDSKDAYDYIITSLPEISWNKISISGGDKTVRATPLEAIFEAVNHVHVIRGLWNEAWLDEIMKFTGLGDTHDDQVDNLSAGYIFFNTQTVQISKKTQKQLAKRHKKR